MGIHWDLGAIPGCPKFSILTQGGAPGIFPLLPRFLKLGILGATPHFHLLPNPEISQIPPFEVQDSLWILDVFPWDLPVVDPSFSWLFFGNAGLGGAQGSLEWDLGSQESPEWDLGSQ